MKTVEELADEWRYNNCNHRDFENIKDANRAAEKVVEAFKAGFREGMNDQLWPASQKTYLDNWIKTSERLPEDDRQVLLTGEGQTTQGYWEYGYWHEYNPVDATDLNVPFEVTHWAELPKGPKEGKE